MPSANQNQFNWSCRTNFQDSSKRADYLDLLKSGFRAELVSETTILSVIYISVFSSSILFISSILFNIYMKLLRKDNLRFGTFLTSINLTCSLISCITRITDNLLNLCLNTILGWMRANKLRSQAKSWIPRSQILESRFYLFGVNQLFSSEKLNNLGFILLLFPQAVANSAIFIGVPLLLFLRPQCSIWPQGHMYQLLLVWSTAVCYVWHHFC